MTDLSGDALAASMIANADAAGGDAPKTKSALVPTIAAVAILTLVAVGGGAGVGYMIGGQSPAEAGADAEAPAAAAEASASTGVPAPEIIVPLPPILTNLSAPAGVVLRIEASIIVDKTKTETPEVLAGQIQADTIAFLRTVDLAQIEGARGLLHLREDLLERAKIRSPAVEDYLIQSLVAQ